MWWSMAILGYRTWEWVIKYKREEKGNEGLHLTPLHSPPSFALWCLLVAASLGAVVMDYND